MLLHPVGKRHGGHQHHLFNTPKGFHQRGVIEVVGWPHVDAPLHEVRGFAHVAHQGGDFRGRHGL
jgi:hypothetical protein